MIIRTLFVSAHMCWQTMYGEHGLYFMHYKSMAIDYRWDMMVEWPATDEDKLRVVAYPPLVLIDSTRWQEVHFRVIMCRTRW